MKKRVVLAYSGGLDTTLSLNLLQEKYGYDVVTVTINIGNEKNWAEVKQRAADMGAIESHVLNLKEEFAEEFILYALQANALYEGKYPLATALARPLMARSLVGIAEKHGAVAVAHGCSGKGNDQLRFDHTIASLNAELEILAPIREGEIKRTEALKFMQKSGEEGKDDLFSIDENIWGRSIECGPIEEEWLEAPESIYSMTREIADTPDSPEYIEIAFEYGKPIKIDGRELSLLEIIDRLNIMGGSHGIGRVDHIESRVVGIKSREIYEAPAAFILHSAHKDLEFLTLTKRQLDLKKYIADLYADMIYQGLWYTGFHRDLRMYVLSTQSAVHGTVKIKLFKGNIFIVGRKSKYSLYNKEISSYESFDGFDSKTAGGFIKLHGLESLIQIKKQGELLIGESQSFKKLLGE